jgi:hypothetical protein
MKFHEMTSPQLRHDILRRAINRPLGKSRRMVSAAQIRYS